MKMFPALPSAALVVLCLTQPGAAADAERGRAVSAPCATCHGSNGIATAPMYPNLAGQNVQYFVNALEAYRDGGRSGGTAGLMVPMAKQLSDQDMQDLAAYYQSLGRE